MSHESDFGAASRPFAVGSLVGMRAFRVDDLNRLVGPSYGQVFHPGENVAECRKRQATVQWQAPGGMTYFLHGSALGAPASFTIDPAFGEPVELQEKAPEHTLAGLGCGCGFYAYFDGANDYGERDRVTAIIEGYGVCSVGSRGFRAEKARLLALVRPPRAVERNYPEVPVYDRKTAAVMAHPLSTELIPSPRDADFWTRDPK